MTANRSFQILSLDGGGAKGFYSLGILKQVEATLKAPLCNRFDLIFGTSTGSIIGAMLALGKTVDEIHGLYRQHVPTVMRARSAKDKSLALEGLADSLFVGAKFDAFKTGIGIVATHWDLHVPLIFKNELGRAHGRVDSFVPGFGCTISEAVQASCSAYPFFRRKTLRTESGAVEAFDGGYCANNPTLYAIADAVSAWEGSPSDLRVLSIGVGKYPEPPVGRIQRLKRWAISGAIDPDLLERTLSTNTESMERLRSILFRSVPTVRINDAFAQPEMAVTFMESDEKKLNLLYRQGSESFGGHEAEFRALFMNSVI